MKSGYLFFATLDFILAGFFIYLSSWAMAAFMGTVGIINVVAAHTND